MAKIQPGICPYCGSSDIEYGSVEHGDDCICYMSMCNDCHKEFREYFDLYFSGMSLDDAPNQPYLFGGDIYEEEN